MTPFVLLNIDRINIYASYDSRTVNLSVYNFYCCNWGPGKDILQLN